MKYLGPLLILAACAGGEPDPCAAFDPFTLELGTGEETFETLEDGQPVMMVHGPQGGWHMLASARLENTTERVELHFVITHLDSGVVVADNTYKTRLETTGECQGQFVGMYGYLNVFPLAEGDDNTPPELLSYEDLRFDMTATDSEGRIATDSRLVLAEPDPMDVN